MRRRNCLVIAALLVGGLAVKPVAGEQIEYYVWTDENGVIHAEGAPPEDGEYETRVIELDENVIPSPEPAAATEGGTAASPGGGTADSGSDDRDSDSGTERSAPPTPPFDPGTVVIPAVIGP